MLENTLVAINGLVNKEYLETLDFYEEPKVSELPQEIINLIASAREGLTEEELETLKGVKVVETKYILNEYYQLLVISYEDLNTSFITEVKVVKKTLACYNSEEDDEVYCYHIPEIELKLKTEEDSRNNNNKTKTKSKILLNIIHDNDNNSSNNINKNIENRNSVGNIRKYYKKESELLNDVLTKLDNLFKINNTEED